jgi:paraquat-inducible protein B
MGKKASPFTIGVFVVTAVALAVVGVTVFGSGRFFRRTETCVIYFKRSVNGLRVGAPVKVKGVEIGAVKRILLRLGSLALEPEDVRIPVIIEIDRDRMAKESEGGAPSMTVEEAIALGLRAQLVSESLVTGLLYIELDFHPGTPATLVNDPSVKYPEIPTLPTALERVEVQASEIITKLSETDFRGLVESLRQAVDSVKDLVASPKLHAAVDGLEGTEQSLNAAIADIRRLTGTVQGEIGPLGQRLNATADKAETALDGVRVLVEPGSPVTYQLGHTLEEVAAAARSVHTLADALERDPSMLVRGRYVAER